MTPNHALQRTGSAVTAPAALHHHLFAHRQVPRPLRLSPSLGSLGVARAYSMKIASLALIPVLLASCVSFDRNALPVSVQRARSLDQFAGTYRNAPNGSGASLAGTFLLDYGVGEEQPTQVELRRTAGGLEAVALHGARVGHSRILYEGGFFTFTRGYLQLPTDSSRHDVQFFLANLKSRSTASSIARLSSAGDLVISTCITTNGTTWGVPLFESKSRHSVHKRIR